MMLNYLSRSGAMRLTAVLLSLGVCVPVAAQPVYRCGNVYSSTPCEGGKTIDAADPRTPEQAKAARDSARRDAAQAKTLTTQRERLEAAEARALAAANAAAQQEAAAQTKAKDKAKEREAAAKARQAQQAPAGQRKRGCVPSEKVSCPEFTAVGPVPSK